MMESPDKFPHPVYTRTVLQTNFEDAKQFFLDSFLDIEYAHCLMLLRQGVLSRPEARSILAGLAGLNLQALRQSGYDGTYEDLFFLIEGMLEETCGREIAGKLHIARSRNDIAITLYRMEVRKRVLHVITSVLDLADVLTRIASDHLEAVMPAHTHTQPAQPTTLAHYLAAAVEFLLRDVERLKAAYATVNRSPMGACAITTTGFPIDRDYTAALLAFDGLQVNSYGAIGAIDYVLEAAGAVSIAMVNTGKLLHDLLLWCMAEFGFLRLSDAFVQISSIMPQKRNPVSLEHARILASRAHAEAQAVFSAAHNTPFGDIVDSEDDLFPLVFLMFTDASRSLDLIAAALSQAHFDRAAMAKLAGARFLTVTELADTLVREERISFRHAHHLVATTVRENTDDDSHQRIVSGVRRLAPGVLGRELNSEDRVLLRSLDPVNFVTIRTIVGGPAPQTVQAELSKMDQKRQASREWLAKESTRLEAYRGALRTESDVV